MRNQLRKLRKGISTKSERRFSEILKSNHIPFRSKVVVNGREVDFIIGKYAIDIDGHQQDGQKNVHLVNAGYIPIHFANREVDISDQKLIKKLKQL